MAFVYGKDNESAEALAKTQLSGIEARVRRENPGWNEDQIKGRLQFTDVKAIPGTKLGGSQLLGIGDTQAFIKKYVDRVMDDRGPRDPRGAISRWTPSFGAFRASASPRRLNYRARIAFTSCR